MRRVTIFGKTLTHQEIRGLKALAEIAGCDGQEIEAAQAIGDPNPDVDDDLVLILATPATCSLPDLESEMAKAMNGARRVIWVWPEDGSTTEVPEPTKKYSYSIVPWDAEKLARVIADDDVICFETPTGDPLPKEKTERNICVEEQKKPK